MLNMENKGSICYLCKEKGVKVKVEDCFLLQKQIELNDFFQILKILFPFRSSELDLNYNNFKDVGWWCGKCTIVMKILKETLDKINELEIKLQMIKNEIEPLLFIKSEKQIEESEIGNAHSENPEFGIIINETGTAEDEGDTDYSESDNDEPIDDDNDPLYEPGEDNNYSEEENENTFVVNNVDNEIKSEPNIEEEFVIYPHNELNKDKNSPSKIKSNNRRNPSKRRRINKKVEIPVDLKCKICKKVLKDANRYRDHSYNHEKVNCPIPNCNEKVSKRRLWRHKRTHHDQKQKDPPKRNICRSPSCLESFTNHGTMHRHAQKAHPELRVLKCPFYNDCKQSFVTQFLLNLHVRYHHRDYLTNSKKYKSNPSNLGEKIKCDICKKAVFEKLLQIHKEREHTYCKICDAKLLSFKNLRVHMQTHNKVRNKYTCKICKRTYTITHTLNSDLRAHMKKFHDGSESEMPE